MSYGNLLLHRATIRRKTYGAVDTHGQETETWADLATGVHCRLVWVTETSAQEFYEGKVVSTPFYQLFLPKSQDILVRDRITAVTHKNGTVMDAGPFDVEEVTSRSDKHGPHHVECRLRRVIEGGT